MARTGVFILALATLLARAAAEDGPCETPAPGVAPKPAPAESPCETSAPVPAPVPPPAPVVPAPTPAPAPATVKHAHPFYGYGGICEEGYTQAGCGGQNTYPAAIYTVAPTPPPPPPPATTEKPMHYYYIGRGFCADELGEVFDAWALNQGFSINQCEEICDTQPKCLGFDTTTHGLCILRYQQADLPADPPTQVDLASSGGRTWKKWTKGGGDGPIDTVHPNVHFACYSKAPRQTTTVELVSTSTSFGQAPPIPKSTPFPDGKPGDSSTLVPKPDDCKPTPDPACVFPFTYQEVTYEECTSVDKNNGAPWCSLDEEYDGHWRDCTIKCENKEDIGAIIGGTVGGAAAITGIGLIAGAATGGLGGPAPGPIGFKQAPTQVIAAPVAVGAVKLYAKEGEIAPAGTQVSKYGSALSVIAGLTAITLLASGVVYAVRRHVRVSRVINTEEDLEQSAAISDGDVDGGSAPLIMQAETAAAPAE